MKFLLVELNEESFAKGTLQQSDIMIICEIFEKHMDENDCWKLDNPIFKTYSKFNKYKQFEDEKGKI